MIQTLKKLILPFFLCSAVSTLNASVVINEAMPSNLNTYMDKETYEYSPWVELYNNGKQSVNINGYSFLYKPLEEDTIKEYTIDYDCKIAAGEYVLFFFDKVAGKQNHTSYKLDADGGMLTLMNSAGKEVSSLNIPDICSYVSYGVNGKSTGYMEPTPGAANDTAYVATTLSAFQSKHQCAAPVFNKIGGVVIDEDKISIAMSSATSGAQIYYTTDGTVPTEKNGKLYSEEIEFEKTAIVRARAYAKGKICSPITTASYIFNDYKHKRCGNVGQLPIVSVVTDIKNFESDTYGIGIKGTNGIKGICESLGVANFNQDWKRPMNFEFIVDGKVAVNHELEGKVMGGCSRGYEIKSLALSASKKCGSGKNKMKYAFFTDKPTLTKYKSVHLRNGGNDFDGMRFRDGIMQSFIQGTNIDYQAYRPVAYYINGKYQGLMLLNEHVNSDYVYTNYNLDDDEIDFVKLAKKIEATEGDLNAYNELISEAQIGQNTSNYYEKMNKLMDMDEYMTYMAFEQFIVNTDWPGNNQKLWRHRKNGRFRWIVYDTDFGFGLYPGYGPNYTTASTNMVKFCAGVGSEVNWGNGSNYSPYTFTEESKWKTVLFANLMKNEEFKSRFLTKNLMLLQTCFKSDVLKAKIDSIATDAYPEYCAMKANNDWNPDLEKALGIEELNTMREFAEKRPSIVIDHLADFLGGSKVSLNIKSNVAGTKWVINGLYWDKDQYEGKYVTNMPLSVTPIAPAGYVFKNWKLSSAPSSTIITNSTEWDYLYSPEGADEGWKDADFKTTGWLKGEGKFGFSSDNEGYTTIIDYGKDSKNKPITAYFRTKINLKNIADFEKFSAKIAYDDAYILYVNGKEISRDNIDGDSIVYSSLANDYTNDAEKEFFIASKNFKEGENIIAVEIHQNEATSSDLTFAMTLNGVGKSTGVTSKEATYKTTVNDDYTMEAVFEKDVDVQRIFVNEICTSNKNVIESSEVKSGYIYGYADEYNKYGDWIELYNASDDDVNIAGWYITDNASKPTKYQIPTTDPTSTIVPAHGYKMIWCDEDIWNGPLHVSFKLGDTKVNKIVLSSTPTTIVDSMSTIISVGTNQSYGRIKDGETKRQHFKNNCKTPMAANGSITDCLTCWEHDSTINNTIILYPNPVSDELNIESGEEEIKKITVYDNVGRLITILTCNSKEVSVNTNDLSKGIYQINIETAGNNVRMKFIKK